MWALAPLLGIQAVSAFKRKGLGVVDIHFTSHFMESSNQIYDLATAYGRLNAQLAAFSARQAETTKQLQQAADAAQALGRTQTLAGALGRFGNDAQAVERLSTGLGKLRQTARQSPADFRAASQAVSELYKQLQADLPELPLLNALGGGNGGQGKRGLFKSLPASLKTVRSELAGVARETFDLYQQLNQAEIRRTDQLISEQERRVQAAAEVAKRGNAQELILEQERLRELQQQRAKAVQQQQALAVVELVTNSAVAIAKAAAQGGIAAPFTIAATLVALAAGLAQAKAQAEAALPRAERGGVVGRGALVDVRRGGLLAGPRHSAGGIAIEAEGGERIIDRRRSAAFAPVLDAIQQTSLASLSPRLFDARYHVSATTPAPRLDRLEQRLDAIVQALRTQPQTTVHIDDQGIYTVVRSHQQRAHRLDAVAR